MDMKLAEPLTKRESEIVELISKGMSNSEIARELVVTTGTIKWYNRQIYSKLGVHSRTQAIARARDLRLFERKSEPLRDFPEVYLHNLPAQMTSFIGRQREISDITNLVKTSRLVTLTGPGGVGKTRLALRAAQDLLESYPDGVFLVSLAQIRDPSHLASTIAQTLDLQKSPGQPFMDSLKDYLADKQTLLILDNFEQIVESAILVAELLAASPDLRVLVTSRETLNLYGEHEYPVHPMQVARFDRLRTLKKLSQVESIQLFFQRARGIKPDFAITEGNVLDIAQICARLDGLPLAVELAAARVKLFTPEMILSRLGSRLETLGEGARDAPARLRTLRGALDWSYDLLDGGEKVFFVRLSVFRSGFTADAAESVCSPGLNMDALDGLESLLNKNLIFLKESPGSEPRFYMLETIHEYASKKLEDDPEADRIRARHAAYFAKFARQVEAEFKDKLIAVWIARLRVELGNIHAAISWSLSGGDTGLGARLILDLREFWFYENYLTYEGYIGDVLRWINRAVEFVDELPPEVGANVLSVAGDQEFNFGNYTAGEQLSRRSLELARESGDQGTIALSLKTWSCNSSAFPDYIEEGITCCEEALAIFRKLDDRYGIAKTINLLGELSRLAGDYERAKRSYEESVEISLQEGYRWRYAVASGNLAYVAMHEGDPMRAEALLREKFTALLELDFKYCTVLSIGMLAGPASAKGQPARAARLLAASLKILDSMGLELQPADRFELDQYRESIMSQLDGESFEQVWAEGREMSLDQAVDYALDKNAE